MPANEKRHVFTYHTGVAVSPEQDATRRSTPVSLCSQMPCATGIVNGETPARESFPEPFGERWHQMP